MLTTMTEEDWTIVLKVFEASRSRRGDNGRNDRKFLEALQYFVVHNITWRALPEKFGHWNSIWKRLRRAGGNERDGASGADVRFHHSARPCLGGGRKKGAAWSGTRSLAWRLLDQDSLEDRFRWLTNCLSSHRLVRPAIAATSRRFSTSRRHSYRGIVSGRSLRASTRALSQSMISRPGYRSTRAR